ncbi:hypothetical protein PRNP1_001554 [Phytophthora ramorum]
MDKLVQLQAALRAIETGNRLESVDNVLVRQVLLQPRAQPQQATREPDARDIYRELQALRKAKAKASAKQNVRGNESSGETSDVGATPPSPKKMLAPARHHCSVPVVDGRLESAPSSPERHSNNDNELVVSTADTIELMQKAFLTREKELKRSEEAVARADAELREELSRAEKILPSKFLFERNLAGDRALEAARNVLLRFQHRFYQLYFRQWWRATLELRLQAQRRAVAEIVRVYRGHRGRQEARRLRRELSVLQAQERQLLAFRMKFRSSQATKLQMAWRRYLRHRAIKYRQARQAAARLLQQAFRTRQWRGQSLVNALANARKLFAVVGVQKLYRGHRTRRKLAEANRRQRQEARVQLALLRNMSKQARAAWMIERCGAGYLIAHRAMFPYAMRLRWHRAVYQLRRQAAAECIARAVCKWFGVEARREAARAKQVGEWLALVQREHQRSRSAAVLIQKHLRRWVQQRKFLMAQARRKKLARKTRLAEKARRLEQTPQRKSPGWLGSDRKPPVATSPKRKPSRFMSNNSLSPQPARLMSFLKPIPLKDGNTKAAHKTNVEAAALVQRNFRRYCARKKARVRAWKHKARAVEARVLQRRKAATEIQRRVRGIAGRTLARRRRAERLLVRFMLRWKWRRIHTRQRAARKIARWFKHKRTQQLARLWRAEKQKRLAASLRMLRWYRARCLLPSRLGQILRMARKRDDTLVFCEQSFQLCRQHMADELVVQSLGASLEDALRPLLSDLAAASRSPSKFKTSPTKQKAGAALSRKHYSAVVAFPVLQMLFLVASGWKMPLVWRELNGRTLFQTKLERAKAIALFRSLSKRGKPVAHQLQQSPAMEATPTVPSPTRRTQKSPAKGSVAVETFSSVDVDVAVARATAGAKGALDFAAFVRVIGLLGEISLAQQAQSASPYWGRYDGTEARVLALLWRSLLPHSSMQPLVLEFEAYVSSELSRHAACLQRLFARQHNKLHGAAMLVEMRRILHNAALSRAAVVLQTQARKLLARRELRRRMKETYEKFLDPTWGLPYWMNPRSGYSTWQKPRLLGAEDVCCEPVPFPPPERTLKASCNGKKSCHRCAEWVCYDCDEFFCLECFGEYHKSKPVFTGEEDSKEGNDPSLEKDENVDPSDNRATAKREHELERLQLCGLCKFQLASRRCLGCAPKVDSKPKLKAKPRSGKQKDKRAVEHGEEELPNSESLFCDVCFGFLHRRGGLKAHRTEPLLELCTSCMPDEEDGSAASHKLPATKYEISGVGDAVQWECQACGDPPRRVCGRCAHQSHPRESCGELRPVPLQTLGRRQRTKRLEEEQEARDRADLDKIRARTLRARQERSARKLQAFWRSQAPILRARRLVAARRREKGALWLRRQEDHVLAQRMAYRAKNLLGMASPLTTDSPVERRLRSLHALARRQLSIRARFFGLLIDEYVTVGVPLPGLGLLHPGSNEIWTSEDLRGWIRNRQTIRLKKLSPQEAQPAERALCAWRQLERWGSAEIEAPEPESQGKDAGAQPPEATETSWLVDTHPKQAITERMVPLAQSYDPPLPKTKRRKAAGEEEEVVEDVPVAMFLVEFSLDPKRTVWINHSLAERFWEWKRLKLLARSERTAQRQRAKDYQKQQKDKWKQHQERNRQENGAIETEDAPPGVESSAAVDAVVEQPWAASNSAWTADGAATDAYYNYNSYPSTDASTAADARTGYDGYSTNYPASYDYGYASTAPETAPPVVAEEATGLVDSENYYANGDYGSGTSNWYGTEYSAYEMSGYGPAATSSDNSGWASYSAESQLSIDPNAWYANTGDASYNWQQSQPAQDQGSGTSSHDSYSIDLPSATNGYYDPYTDDQQYSTPQSEWEEVFDPATQQTYYVNRVTNETAWQLP